VNLRDLIALARTRLADTVPPYLWSDFQLTEFANTAILEALERSRLKYDRTPSEVTTIQAISGQRSYPLDASIQSIRRVRVQIAGIPEYDIPNRGIQDLIVRVGVGWPLQEGDPYSFWVDQEGLNLYPVPNHAGVVLQLEVHRRALPAEGLSLSSDVPDIIPVQYQRDLVYWIVREAYMVHDSDLEDQKRAMANELYFERRFGYRPSAKAERFAATAPLGAPIYNQRFGGI
jgi:hypothetical protein